MATDAVCAPKSNTAERREDSSISEGFPRFSIRWKVARTTKRSDYEAFLVRPGGRRGSERIYLRLPTEAQLWLRGKEFVASDRSRLLAALNV